MMTKTTETTDDLAYQRPRPMSKGELARLYAPRLTDNAAVKRLMLWIDLNTELKQQLAKAHYQKMQRIFTVRQVELIFQYLGQP